LGGEVIVARMVRKQIVIDAEREKLLETMAAEAGVSQSEVIRRAIDALATQSATEAMRDAAFERLMRSFRDAPDLGLTDSEGRRTWTRESLHERGIR
jgi:hypothetical protein